MRMAHPLLGKLAAIALLGIVATAVHVLMVSPILHRIEFADERIEEQRRLLGRLTTSLQAARTDGTEDTSLVTGLNFIVLPGQSEQIKAASLQARVTKAADDAGIRISSLAVLPARTEHAVRLVGTELQFQAGLPHVQRFLLSLETQRPTVIVDTLHISRAPDADARPGRELDIRLIALGIVGKAEDAQ